MSPEDAVFLIEMIDVSLRLRAERPRRRPRVHYVTTHTAGLVLMLICIDVSAGLLRGVEVGLARRATT